MSNLLHRPRRAVAPEPVLAISPETVGWTYVGFEVYHLQGGDRIAVSEADAETALIAVTGTVQCEREGVAPLQMGGRDSVFVDAAPETLLLSPPAQVTVTALTDAELVVAKGAGGRPDGRVRKISMAEVQIEDRGTGGTARTVRQVLDEDAEAHKLLLVEVVTPPGNWSSFPPHKHDEEIPGVEAYIEELYYFHIEPATGWALQRIYAEDGWSETLTVHDGDLVVVPRGYHVVTAPPGFQVYYLNVMAGHHRQWRYRIDPTFRHVAPPDGNIRGTIRRAPNP